jgi:hypothetical protein
MTTVGLGRAYKRDVLDALGEGVPNAKADSMDEDRTRVNNVEENRGDNGR